MPSRITYRCPRGHHWAEQGVEVPDEADRRVAACPVCGAVAEPIEGESGVAGDEPLSTLGISGGAATSPIADTLGPGADESPTVSGSARQGEADPGSTATFLPDSIPTPRTGRHAVTTTTRTLLEADLASPTTDDDREPAERLAEEFLERRRRGERPTVEEYAARHPALASEIRELFSALLLVEDLRPATGDATDPGERPAVGEGSHPGQLGEFRLLRVIGRGGMGVVYEAVQESLGRVIAVKAISSRRATDGPNVRRFLLEARVNGHLEHPGIVPVHGLGQDAEGRPFYVMRLVRGGTLRDAIDRFHQESEGANSRPLELRQLLRRFVDACNAVAYAHSKGVLHRDLKPENILLGSFGETLVVDWGLAKSVGDVDPDPDTESPGFESTSGPSETLPGQVLGTPRYMSPEQAEGDAESIGPRSDVYSLGATLYTLLTGRAALDGMGVRDLLARVCRGDFPPPHQVRRGVPRPLESICLKAMALRPEDRYASPADLAGDVERWLADDAVAAHPDGVVARLGRWARRHRTAVVGVVALLLTATVALAIGTVLLGRESARREGLRRQAVRNFILARDAVDRMLSRVGEVELAEVPQMESVRRQLLEEALLFCEELTRQRGDDPASRLELGRARIRLARVEELLGDPHAAERHYRLAIAELEPLSAAALTGVSSQAGLARARDGLGMLLKRSNRFREAEVELRAALRIREVLARESAGDAALDRDLAESRYHLGALLARSGDRGPEDERAYLAAVTIQRRLVDEARDRDNLSADLARSLNNLGLLLADAGRVDEALRAFREAEALLAELTSRLPGVAGHRWLRARALSNLGVLLPHRGDLSGAEAALGRARESLEALAADFPTIPDYRRDLASVHNNFGLLFAAAGRPRAAEDAYAQALLLQEELVASTPTPLPDDRQRLATTRLNLGLLRLGSDPEGAEADFRNAVAEHSQLVESHPEVPEYRDTLGTALAALGRARWSRGDLEGARRSLDEAITRHRSALRDFEDREGRARLHADYGMLALVLEGLGDHVGLAHAAEQLPALFPDQAEDYLRAAAFIVRSAELAGSDPGLSDADRSTRRDELLNRAVDWLIRARGRKLLADPAVLDRPEFAPLQGRPDFDALRQSNRTPSGRPVRSAGTST